MGLGGRNYTVFSQNRKLALRSGGSFPSAQNLCVEEVGLELPGSAVFL